VDLFRKLGNLPGQSCAGVEVPEGGRDPDQDEEEDQEEGQLDVEVLDGEEEDEHGNDEDHGLEEDLHEYPQDPVGTIGRLPVTR